jgi:hypothetical protein
LRKKPISIGCNPWCAEYMELTVIWGNPHLGCFQRIILSFHRTGLTKTFRSTTPLRSHLCCEIHRIDSTKIMPRFYTLPLLPTHWRCRYRLVHGVAGFFFCVADLR